MGSRFRQDITAWFQLTQAHRASLSSESGVSLNCDLFRRAIVLDAARRGDLNGIAFSVGLQAARHTTGAGDPESAGVKV